MGIRMKRVSSTFQDMPTNSPSPLTNSQDISAARGLITGGLMSLALWIPIILLAYRAFHSAG